MYEVITYFKIVTPNDERNSNNRKLIMDHCSGDYFICFTYVIKCCYLYVINGLVFKIVVKTIYVTSPKTYVFIKKLYIIHIIWSRGAKSFAGWGGLSFYYMHPRHLEFTVREDMKFSR